MFVEILDHEGQAVGRLISQYRGKPRVEGLTAALVSPFQDIETALVELNTERSINAGTGIQLDNLGQVVGLLRLAGQNDDDYRRDLKAQIKINTSEGQPGALTSAFLLLTNTATVIFDEFFPAAIMMESTYRPTSRADGFALNEIIDTVAAGGVRMEGVVAYDPDAAFSFDGPFVGSGLGDNNDANAGGAWAELFVPGGEFAFAGADASGQGFGTNDDPLVGGLMVSL